MTKFWSTLDAIYCINLRSRPDRYQQAQQVFAQLGLSDRVEFYQPERDSENGLRGCYNSHRHLIQKSLAAGQQRILIFEDDVICSQQYAASYLDEVHDFLEQNNDWELFYLGTLPEIRSQKISTVPNFAHIRQMASLCTHAYLVSLRGMQKYSQLPYADIPLDYLYIMASQQKCYGVHPSLFDQRASRSDIGGKYDWFPWKEAYFRFVQNYAERVNIPLNVLRWGVIL